MSCISLLLCLSMLVGTTFAWFTDSVTSGVNQIVAGNLDIEVSYKNTPDGAYADLAGSESVFSKGFWEPGHTEFVTLKIENKGSLALNYKVLVSPVSEAGGINVNGEIFKLSDYLMFGTALTGNVASREAARELVAATATGLNQANLTKTGTMEAGGEAQYITLVIYMPETVGNEANYLTGTQAPKIELGITVLATQKTFEDDSFGDDYDAGAVESNFNGVGPVYNYFPQIVASKPIPENNTAPVTVTANGKLNKDDANTTTLAEVTVPANAIADGATEISVSVKPVAATDSGAQNTIQTETNNGREAVNFDIHVDGIKDQNDVPITVQVFVGKGLSNVKAYHNGVEIQGAQYDAENGNVTFTTTSFSDYTVAYDPAVAAIGTQTFGTLELAIAAAQNGQTVVLLKNINLESSIQVNKTLKIDGNGMTVSLAYTGTPMSGNAIFNCAGMNEGLKTALNVSKLNMKMTGTEKNGYAVVVAKGDVPFGVTFDKCTFENMWCGVMANGCAGTNAPDITISNSTFKNVSYGVSFADKTYVKNVNFNNNIMSGETAIQETFEAPYLAAPTVEVVNGTYSVNPAAFVKAPSYVVGTSAPFTVAKCENHAWGEDGYCSICHAPKAAAPVAPTATVTVNSQVELNSAVSDAEAGDVIAIATAGTYKVPGIPKNIDIVAAVEGVVFDCVGSGSIASIPNGCTFWNASFNFGNNNYHGFQHAGHIVMNNCTLNGLFFSYGDMDFNYCTFNQTASEYSMWCYAGNIKYSHCTINCNGKFANVYNEGNGTWKVYAEDCVFNSTKANKAALNVKESCCNGKELHFDIKVDRCTTTGLWPVASGDETSTLIVLNSLVQIDDRTASTISNSKQGNGARVTLDGTVIYPAG